MVSLIEYSTYYRHKHPSDLKFRLDFIKIYYDNIDTFTRHYKTKSINYNAGDKMAVIKSQLKTIQIYSQYAVRYYLAYT